MTQSISISISLGARHTGLSDLRAQLIDSAGANVGAAVSTGFVVLGNAANGNYGWTGSVADDFQGFVNIYSLATPTVAAVVGVNQLADMALESLVEQHVTNALNANATLTAIAADTNDIQTRLPASLTADGYIKADALKLNGTTPNNVSINVTSAVVGSDITILRGDTVVIALTGLGNISARTALYFSVKGSLNAPDSDAILQVTESAGLVVLNKSATVTASDASLHVDDATAGDITITLKPNLTKQFAPVKGLQYDVQMVTATAVTTLTNGAASVTADVTRAVA